MQTREAKLSHYAEIIAEKMVLEKNWQDEEIGTAEISLEDYDQLTEILSEEDSMTKFIEGKTNDKKLQKLEEMFNNMTFIAGGGEEAIVEAKKETFDQLKNEFPGSKKKNKPKIK